MAEAAAPGSPKSGVDASNAVPPLGELGGRRELGPPVNQVMVRHITKVVARATAELDTGAIQGSVELERLLTNPATLDIVYTKVVMRAECANDLVLERCLRLLKRYLPYRPPSAPVLQDIDRFCKTCSAASRFGPTLQYVRALVASAVCKQKTRTPLVASSAAAALRLGASGSTTNRRTGPSTTSSSLATATEDEEQEKIISNFLTLRLATANSDQSKTRCLLAHPVFGGVLPPTQPPIMPSNPLPSCLQMREVAIKERIATVNADKKMEEQKVYNEEGLQTVRRKGLQLFQFKYYSQQQPLQLSEQELESVMSGVISPPADDRETRLIASKILIKVLVDEFMNGSGGTAMLLSIATKLLDQSEAEAQLHALNLVFNLSVHLNLWEEFVLVDDYMADQASRSQRAEQVRAKQQELFAVVQSVLQHIHKSADRMHETIWPAALNLLLFWITDEGRIVKETLEAVHVTHVTMFLQRRMRSGEAVEDQLVRMLCNKLYAGGSLDAKVLQAAGGISFVLDLYVSVRTVEARDNLFLVIYDVLVQPSTKRKLTTRRYDSQLHLLRDIEAPQCFHQLFKVVPAGFVPRVLEFICPQEQWGSQADAKAVMLETGANTPIVNVNRNEFSKTLQKFQDLANQYNTLSEEYQKEYAEMFMSEDGDYSTLNALLNSNRADDRKNGELWLFNLLIAKRSNGQACSKAESTFNLLLRSDKPEVKRIYLSITERLVLSLRSTMTVPNHEPTLMQMTQIMREYCGRAISVISHEESNLLYAYDILLQNFITTTYIARRESATDEETCSSLSSMFIRGKAVLPKAVIDGVSVGAFRTIFTNLTSKHFPEIRVTLLLVIIEKCRQSENLEAIGGIPFIRNLLVSRDADIAYHCSRFLIDQLEAERPEEYKLIMNRLVSKALENSNEKLLANSYLQIKACLAGL